MRENRTCSSEGGEPGDRASLPYRTSPPRVIFPKNTTGWHLAVAYRIWKPYKSAFCR